MRLELISLEGVPRVAPGDDLAALIIATLTRNNLAPREGDLVAVTSKLLSRAEGRFVDLSEVSPSQRAQALALEVDKDPRLVEVILNESTAVSRAAKGVLIVRHRLGHVCANAGVDSSNARPPGASDDSGPWVLLLPENPDARASELRAELARRTGTELSILITDSLGRPFRQGTVGFAIGSAGFPPLSDARGQLDLDGRPLEHTLAATADQLAAAADLVAGQAAEGRPITLFRGLELRGPANGAALLNRDPKADLYA
ncbi:MAG: coenzyme F420-0:L-glutamate ligase [Myxococcales bacterium]|nr:coenzyme F420-0:L-glutamate ligase [Myxococcales bacterium]MDD9970216.1 coenzyme F420-0:L-glutamate ligase [Myxococcales bacterium]